MALVINILMRLGEQVITQQDDIQEIRCLDKCERPVPLPQRPEYS